MGAGKTYAPPRIEVYYFLSFAIVTFGNDLLSFAFVIWLYPGVVIFVFKCVVLTLWLVFCGGGVVIMVGCVRNGG